MVLQLESNGEQRLSLLKPEFGDQSNDPLPELPKSWVGVEVQPFTASLAKDIGLPGAGFRIARIYPGSPLGAAGAAVGDLLVALDGAAAEACQRQFVGGFRPARARPDGWHHARVLTPCARARRSEFEVTVQPSPVETSGLAHAGRDRLRAQLA